MAGNQKARVTRGVYRGREKADDTSQTAYQVDQDEWQRSMVRAVAEAIEDWLSDNGRLSRRINQLTIEELEGMGVAACSEYVNQRELRRRQKADSLPISDWELGT